MEHFRTGPGFDWRMLRVLARNEASMGRILIFVATAAVVECLARIWRTMREQRAAGLEGAG